jgi:hypothetical protein
MFFYSKCATSFLPFLFEMCHISICFAPFTNYRAGFSHFSNSSAPLCRPVRQLNITIKRREIQSESHKFINAPENPCYFEAEVMGVG